MGQMWIFIIVFWFYSENVDFNKKKNYWIAHTTHNPNSDLSALLLVCHVLHNNTFRGALWDMTFT